MGEGERGVGESERGRGRKRVREGRSGHHSKEEQESTCLLFWLSILTLTSG